MLADMARIGRAVVEWLRTQAQFEPVVPPSPRACRPSPGAIGMPTATRMKIRAVPDPTLVTADLAGATEGVATGRGPISTPAATIVAETTSATDRVQCPYHGRNR